MTPAASQLIDHFFRHESANLVAVLTRAFGIRRIDLIEDMVQAAMLEAMHAWKQRGVPDNPTAWIHRVARNRIVDALRREKTWQKAVALSGQSVDRQERMVDQWLEEDQIPDSLLRMIFVCCHPSLDRKTQIALTLKTLCGFGIAEVARGLLLSGETVKKRIQRAKASLAASGVAVELPASEQLRQRLDAVHDIVYLMFNEGYSTSHGTEPIRDDICEEAVRLCHLLCESSCSSPDTRALLALLLFHAARLDSRTDDDGSVVLLEDQDRSVWDQQLICLAQSWLGRARTDQAGRFHFEAAIAMQHCIADSVTSTDWGTIVRLYSRLLKLCDSPVYSLNRAVALAQAGDTQAAMSELQSLGLREDMKQYVLLDCAIARVHELEGDNDKAVERWKSALDRTNAAHEKQLIEKKVRQISGETRGDSV